MIKGPTNTLRKHNNPKYVHTKQRSKACEENLTEVKKSHSYTRAGLDSSFTRENTSKDIQELSDATNCNRIELTLIGRSFRRIASYTILFLFK